METLPVKYLQTLVLIFLLSVVSNGFAQEETPVAPESDGEQVIMDQFGTVDLVVNETEVSQVLEMLAIQSQKNIIASNSVTGMVSANLYDVMKRWMQSYASTVSRILKRAISCTCIRLKNSTS